MMDVTVYIPDTISTRLGIRTSGDIPRWLLEKAGLGAYRVREISGYELRLMLGLKSRIEVRCLSQGPWSLSGVYR